jgi:GT2 family glycosyltransferase
MVLSQEQGSLASLNQRRGTPDQPEPRASVVLVNFNSGEWGARAAQSVRRQVGVTPELVVVDNASTDGSLDELLRVAAPDRVIVNTENLGYAAAVNQGIRASTGEAVLPLNSDASLSPDYLRIGLDSLDRFPRVAVVGGKVSTTGGGTVRGPLRVTYTMRVRDLPIDRACDCFRVDGACALLRRSALDQVDREWGVGALDPRFFIYGETIDLAFKLRKLGWITRFEPTMEAEHVRSHSSALRVADKRGRMRQLVLASRHINVARHSSTGMRPIATVACLTQDVGFAALQFARGDWSAPADVIGGWRRALKLAPDESGRRIAT